MEIVLNVGTVALVAVIELWAAIPLGFVLKLHTVHIALATGFGGSCGVICMALLGAPIRSHLVRRFFHGTRAYQRVASLTNRYGVPAMGLLAPILVGAPLTALVGLALGAEMRRLVSWSITGIWLWTTGLVILSHIGLRQFGLLS